MGSNIDQGQYSDARQQSSEVETGAETTKFSFGFGAMNEKSPPPPRPHIDMLVFT